MAPFGFESLGYEPGSMDIVETIKKRDLLPIDEFDSEERRNTMIEKINSALPREQIVNTYIPGELVLDVFGDNLGIYELPLGEASEDNLATTRLLLGHTILPDNGSGKIRSVQIIMPVDREDLPDDDANYLGPEMQYTIAMATDFLIRQTVQSAEALIDAGDYAEDSELVINRVNVMPEDCSLNPREIGITIQPAVHKSDDKYIETLVYIYGDIESRLKLRDGRLYLVDQHGAGGKKNTAASFFMRMSNYMRKSFSDFVDSNRVSYKYLDSVGRALMFASAPEADPNAGYNLPDDI